MVSVICAGCGGDLVKPKRGPMPRYCSGACKARAWREANPEGRAQQVKRRVERQQAARSAEDIPCPWCGDPMRPHRQQCGKPDCRRAHAAMKQREFQAGYREQHGKTYGNHRYADDRRHYSALRRARLRVTVVEEFSEVEVFERDGWECGICDQPVDREQAYPHPMSPSLDHFIPLSKGGEHTRDNTRCSHLICNARRGDRIEVPAA